MHIFHQLLYHVQNHVILDRVITALHIIDIYSSENPTTSVNGDSAHIDVVHVP